MDKCDETIEPTLFRDKKGKFVSQKRKRRQDNVLKSIADRKRDGSSASYTFSGRRIVELKTLATELWCSACDLPLSLRDIISEAHHCLASTFEVKCRQCQRKYKVHTSKPHQNATGSIRYSTNGKVVVGKSTILSLIYSNMFARCYLCALLLRNV